MRPRRLTCLAIVLAGLLSGCAGFERRPPGGARAENAAERDIESDRADLLRELSLYSD